MTILVSFFFFVFQFQEKKQLDFINFYFVFFSFYFILFPTFPLLFPAFPPWFPASPPWFPAFSTNSLHFPHSPHSHPYSLHSHPDFPLFTLIPHISIIPLIPFPNSPFRFLQIAKFLHIIVILFSHCCRITYEMKSHHGFNALKFKFRLKFSNI